MKNENVVVRNVIIKDLPSNIVTTSDLMSCEDPEYRAEVRAVCDKYHTATLYFDLNRYDLTPVTYGEIERSRQLDASGANDIVVTDDMLPDNFFKM